MNKCNSRNINKIIGFFSVHLDIEWGRGLAFYDLGYAIA